MAAVLNMEVRNCAQLAGPRVSTLKTHGVLWIEDIEYLQANTVGDNQAKTQPSLKERGGA